GGNLRQGSATQTGAKHPVCQRHGVKRSQTRQRTGGSANGNKIAAIADLPTKLAGRKGVFPLMLGENITQLYVFLAFFACGVLLSVPYMFCTGLLKGIASTVFDAVYCL